MTEATAVDWDALGDCEVCGVPLNDKPGRYHYGRDLRYASRCFKAEDHRCNARHGHGVERCDLPLRECRRLGSEERATRLGVLPSKIAMTAADVERGIRRRHRNQKPGNPEWVVTTEMQVGRRRVDVFALSLWTSKGLRMVGYEVKVDAADLARELRDPGKRAPATALCTQFYFATPVGLMDPGRVPARCGLLEFGLNRRGDPHWHEVVAAPEQERDCVPLPVLYHFAWRLRDLQQRAERRGIVL